MCIAAVELTAYEFRRGFCTLVLLFTMHGVYEFCRGFCTLVLFVQEGISFEDVQAFTELVENISDVEMALSMCMAAGASITPGILYTHTLSLSLSLCLSLPFSHHLVLSFWLFFLSSLDNYILCTLALCFFPWLYT